MFKCGSIWGTSFSILGKYAGTFFYTQKTANDIKRRILTHT